MKAIEKAWEENLKELKDNQWKSKEELTANCCPYGEYKLDLKGFKDDEELCSHYHEHCTECWNTETIEDIDSKDNTNNTFTNLECSSTTGIKLEDKTEDDLKESLKINDYIIRADNGFDYNQIPSLIKWLQEMYDYCTELKNKVEYVGFVEAKEHMHKGNKAKYEDHTYYIKNNNMYYEDEECYLTLKAIESKEWILL